MFIHLAIKSLLSRKGSILLTIFAMSVSILVMLGVEHVREQAKSSFASSVSGVDLIVGSRTSQLNLLLYSVFRIGTPTNNIGWQSFKKLETNKAVNWAVPLSLGDSHKGYRVLGTSTSYFDHYAYGQKQTLTFEQGKIFSEVFDVVLGAQVAKKLGYQIGDKIALSHGIGNTSFKKHDNLPFQVVGILMPTGTPVDQTLHVSLQGLEAVHVSGRRIPSDVPSIAELQSVEQSATPTSLAQQQTQNLKRALTPKSITAVMIGLHSKMAVFHLQRKINTDAKEPLTAIMPGVALSQLWIMMSSFDNTLRLIAVLVFISSLIALSAMLLSSIRERLPEIKLLRMIVASTSFVFWLIELEAVLIALLSTVVAWVALATILVLMRDFILNNYGILIDPNIVSTTSSQMIVGIIICVFIAAIPPALSAFKEAKR